MVIPVLRLPLLPQSVLKVHLVGGAQHLPGRFIGRDGRLRDQLGAESGVLRRARLLSKWSGGEGWGEGQCEVLGHKGT